MKTNKKNRMLCLKVTDEQLEIIKINATKHNMSVSNFLRNLGMYETIEEPLDTFTEEAFEEAFRDIDWKGL